MQCLPEAAHTEEDARNAMTNFVTVEYDNWFGRRKCGTQYTDAGHIIGSAAVHLRITEDGKPRALRSAEITGTATLF